MDRFGVFAMALLGCACAVSVRLLVGRIPGRGSNLAVRAVLFALFCTFAAGALMLRMQFIHTLAMLIPLVTLYVWSTRRIPLYEAFYLGCLFFLCYDLSSLLICNILMSAVWGTPEALDPLARDAVLIVGSSAVLFASTAALRRWFISDMYILPPVQTLLIVVPMVPYAYVRSGLYITAFNGGVAAQYAGEVVLLVMSLVPAFVQMIANKCMLGAQTRKNDVLQMQAMLVAQQQQYLVKRETIDQVRRYYHDMKHFASLLDASRGEGDAPAGASSFERQMAAYSPFVDTGCAIVDVLVGEKVQYCAEHGIGIVPYMDARALNGMDPLELCTLFGNAFDNAIQAVERIADPDAREIRAHLATRGGCAVFTIENPYEPGATPSAQSGRAVGHGYGIPNMRRVVEAHGGTLDVEARDGRFRLVAVLPVVDAGASGSCA